jgi:exonuclease VII small subunit
VTARTELGGTAMSQNRPATTAEMAELEFDGQISSLTARERRRVIDEKVAQIAVFLPLAYEVALASKEELVARVEREHDEIGSRLMELLRATDAAKDAAKLLAGAEARLMIAFAVVEGPDEDEEAEAATRH